MNYSVCFCPKQEDTETPCLRVATSIPFQVPFLRVALLQYKNHYVCCFLFLQFNMTEDGYFENYLQYIIISNVENFASLRTPVDKSVYDGPHQL